MSAHDTLQKVEARPLNVCNVAIAVTDRRDEGVASGAGNGHRPAAAIGTNICPSDYRVVWMAKGRTRPTTAFNPTGLVFRDRAITDVRLTRVLIAPAPAGSKAASPQTAMIGKPHASMLSCQPG